MMQEQNTITEPKNQQISFGNRCGHIKDKFRHANRLGKNKRRPHCLEEGSRRLQKSEHQIYLYPGYLRFLFHTEHRKFRKRRTEGIESIAHLALEAILLHTNLAEMAVGTYDKCTGKFIYFSYAQIRALTCNATIKTSEERFQRAMNVLKTLNLIEVEIIRETLPNGKIIHKETRVKVKDEIFKLLDIHPEFLMDRERALLKQHKIQNKIDDKMKRRLVFQTYQHGQFKPPKTTTTTAKITNKVSMLKSSKLPEDYTTTPRRYPPQLAHIREFLAKSVPTKGPPDQLH